jgi:hypothetical protein
MSTQYPGGFISKNPPLPNGSTARGIWTLNQQAAYRKANLWPTILPGPPTIGTATAGSGQATVTFTAPTNVGSSAITGYTVTSNPGNITASGASSPITVTGLTNGTAYTFTVAATNSAGTGPASAASNSIIPVVQGQEAYTTAGTYTWTAPAGVSSVSVVCVGAGGRGGGGGGGGGGLGWKNNIAVTPGSSYTVVVGSPGTTTANGGNSYFISTGTVAGYGGSSGVSALGTSNTSGGSYTGDGGGNGGNGSTATGWGGGGGGAGGYSGNGGNANTLFGSSGSGGGGGGGAGHSATDSNDNKRKGGGGGGVGILGEGSNGAGAPSTTYGGDGGFGGSSGANGSPSDATFGGGGGSFGGGGGGTNDSSGSYSFSPGSGAVRIIWPGNTRQFPSTNTGNV